MGALRFASLLAAAILSGCAASTPPSKPAPAVRINLDPYPSTYHRYPGAVTAIRPTLWLIAGPDGVGKTTFAMKRLEAVSGIPLPYRFIAASANIAPSGSMHWTIQEPPGTSIGPFRIFPPFAFTRSPPASIASTLK